MSTVDDDVNVTASNSPARTRSSSVGSGSAVTVLVHRDDVDGVARFAQTVGQHVARLLGAREQHPLAGDTRRAGTRATQRLRHEPLGHEIGAHAEAFERRRGPRPDRGDLHARERARCRARARADRA